MTEERLKTFYTAWKKKKTVEVDGQWTSGYMFRVCVLTTTGLGGYQENTEQFINCTNSNSFCLNLERSESYFFC